MEQLTLQQLVKAREVERKKAIAEGKMDDPLVPKRLEDAISIVGTCKDMCPRFERYRRERENNLFEWETVCRLLLVFCLLEICADLVQDTGNKTGRSRTCCEDV
jgi:Nuclear protein export factor